ncbi:uncharacterized protein LOC134258294 [Saccostrea cucullata]|uniref:uncharacterized protein LOC134258294 n=1 Tax=Saccostrea cuccullata TaxID=36930 RepID=UPI002ED4A28A
MSLPKDVKVKYKGLICETFPTLAQEWRVRERKYTFPSPQLIQDILQTGCTLIKKAHRHSKEPDIEWKYNFSMAEHVIFTEGLTYSQLHGFRVLKVLVDNVAFQLTKQLKNKHLKAVYLTALEDIPCDAWETNFSGSILFVITALIACLKARFLPHYFIPTNNLIDCFSETEIEAVCVNVQCLRLFPLIVIQNIVESHGYDYAPKLINMVFENCKSFARTKDITTVFTNAFIPGTVRSVKVMTRLGFYETAFQLLRYVHEQMLLMPMIDDCHEKPSFMELFLVSLKKLHQKSSRIILAKLFDIRFKTAILNEYIISEEFFAKDILPWKMDYRIEYTKIPENKATDFLSLGDIFESLSQREFDKRNATLAGLALETAITCTEEAMKMDSLSIDELTDDSLKKEILSERENIERELKMKLKECYIQLYAISKLYNKLWPLQNHMDAIENLCEEFPEMTPIVCNMFRFIGRENKVKEYTAKCSLLLKERGGVNNLEYNFY